MCLYPRLIDNPKYKANKKNKGIVPIPQDGRVKYVAIGCGNCIECKKKRANEWRVRLLEEHKRDPRGRFLSFSLSDESLVALENDLRAVGCRLEGYELENEIARLAVQRFSDRWKKKFGHRPKRWIVTELGGKNTERVHLHGILFTTVSRKVIDELWGYGNIWIGHYCNERSMNYITKYMLKTDPIHKEYKSRVFTSPGIGKGYTDGVWKKAHAFKGEKTMDFYRMENGYRTGLPIYYRNKLWSDEEREKLWLQMLDKEVRYVRGIEVDVSTEKGQAYYETLREWHRKENKQLGFGSTEIEWDRRWYERQRRRMLKEKRIEKVKGKNLGNKE